MKSHAVRPEVRAFLNASHVLVSPLSAPKDLSREECEAIARCVMELSNVTHQWSKYLLSRYT